MDIHEKIKAEANRVGYEVIATRPISFNSKIFVVLAFNEIEYVTWLFNSEFNGLSSGSYHTKSHYESVEKCYQVAMNNFSERK